MVCTLLVLQVALSIRLPSLNLRGINRKRNGFEIGFTKKSGTSNTVRNKADREQTKPNASINPTPSKAISIHHSEKSTHMRSDPWSDDAYWMNNYHHTSEPYPIHQPDPFRYDHYNQPPIHSRRKKTFVPETYPACGKHGERVDLPASMSSKMGSFDDHTYLGSPNTVGTEMVQVCRMAMMYMEYGHMHRRPSCSGRWKMTSINYDYMCMRMSPRCVKLERDMRRNKLMAHINAGSQDYLAFRISCLREPECGRHGVAQAGQCYEPCMNGLERNGPACVRYMYYEPYCETKDLTDGGEHCTFPGTTKYIQTLKTLGAQQSKYGRFGPLYRKYSSYLMV